MHGRFKLYFVSEIFHRKRENKDGLQNDVESVHAAQTASRIPKSSSDSLTDTKKKEKINKKIYYKYWNKSIGKNHLRNFPNIRQLYWKNS